MNLAAACRVLGKLLLLLAVAELLPVLVAWIYGEGSAALAFAFSALVTTSCGVLLVRLGRGATELFRREGIFIVVGGWVLASIFGGLPYLLTGTFESPVDALFESASGFTTTGASVMTAIEAHGRAVLFWRCFTQWLGGMGIIVLFVALLPEVGPGARFLYKLEVPGPTSETFHPRVRDTALVLWKIYLGFTVAQVAMLMMAGLDLYDSLTHTFSTLSTGGFSPRNASVAAFDSPWVHGIIVLFMVLAGANFSLYYGVRRWGVSSLLRDPEFRLYGTLLAAMTVAITWDVSAAGKGVSIGRQVLDSAFQASSIMTTTGFATRDFDQWPSFSRVLLVASMFVGGCAGSTAGGMKVARMVMGIKFALREVRLLFSPTAVMRVFVGGGVVGDPTVRAVAGFFVLFLTAWGLGSLALTLGGHSPVTAATAAIACLANIGPGLEAVGPTGNFALFGGGHKLLLVALMLIGRLEVYAVAAVFSRRFWRP